MNPIQTSALNHTKSIFPSLTKFFSKARRHSSGLQFTLLSYGQGTRIEAGVPNQEGWHGRSDCRDKSQQLRS